MSLSSKNEAFYLQYSGTPTQGHEELLETLTSPDNNATNKMAQKPVRQNTVHINPKFQSHVATIQSLQQHHSPPPAPGLSPSKQQPVSNTVHINPKFANRPLPGVPSSLVHPGVPSSLIHPGVPASLVPGSLVQPYSRAGLDTTDLASLYQNSSSAAHVYMNSTTGNSDHIYQNLNAVLPQSTAPIYQNSNESDVTTAPREPIYASIGHGIPIDASKKDEFIQSIKHSLQNQMPLTTTATMSSNNSHTATRDNRVQLTASNGVVLRNKYRKDNRPEKPIRNSMVVRPSTAIFRNSVIEKPNRYSLVLEKPKRSSVYVLDNRKPVKPVRHSTLPKYDKIEESFGVTKSVTLSKPTTTTKPSTSVYVPTPSTSTPVSSALASSSSSAAKSAVATTASAALTTPVRKMDEKENLPSTLKKSFLSTPFRKTPFKKIGDRKLIRIKKKSLSPGTPKPSFKRIGNTKLIRIRESLTSDKSSTPNSIYSIKTKTKLVKKVKNTPSNNSKFRFSFITPLSMRKNKIVRQTSFNTSKHSVQVPVKKSRSSSFTSRFKLDRRKDKKDRVIFRRSSKTQLKKLSNGTYHVSDTKLQKLGSTPTSSSPAKPARAAAARKVSIYRPRATALNPNLAPNKLITVQGIKFTVADNGRRLKRVLSESELSAATSNGTVTYSASVSQSQTSPGQSQTSPVLSTSTCSPTAGKNSSPGLSTSRQWTSPKKPATNLPIKKTYIAGEEFDEIEPGVFTRSRHSLTRASITQAKARSINTILKVQNRSKQYCMFYNKFGKCTKKEKGSCPYIHDASKIAVCRRFLQGACTKETCLLSHQLQMDKMPACKFFLEGICTRENCPYLHVKVNDKAGVCEQFLKGFCPNGADCSQRHVIACPEFERTGSCSKVTKCGFPHIQKKCATDEAGKKKAPAPSKPKRKSLGTSEQNLKKSKVAGGGRYYEEGAGEGNPDSEEISTTPASEAAMAEIEERRQRILRKIEQAKQVWRSSMLATDDQQAQDSLASTADTSGVDTGETGLEDIKESDTQESSMSEDRATKKRAPLGKLEDFISLETFSSNSNDEPFNDRLI